MKHNTTELIFSALFGIFAAAAVLALLGAIATLLGGCASIHQSAATTQPVSNPFSNVNAVVYHSQKALEGINVLSFIAALAGVGLAVYGLITADSPLERIGLLVGTIAGVIALGTLLGIIALPFAPWVLLIGVVGGAGYGAYLLIHKYVSPKPAVLTTPKA
jgi:hypothetical protein